MQQPGGCSFQVLSHSNCSRWLTLAMCLMEIFITIGFHEGSPNCRDNPTPLYVVISGSVELVVCLGATCTSDSERDIKRSGHEERR